MRITLDELELSPDEHEPFEIELDEGVIVSLKHPADIPFGTLANFDQNRPAAVLRVLMGDEDFDALAADERVTLGRLGQILARYYAHFGLGDPGNGGASPRSSNGSAGPSKRTSGSRRAKAS